MSLKAKLRKANKLWKEGAHDRAEQEPDFTEVPDGRYIARVNKAELGESESSGRLQVAWGYKVKDGEYEGETIRDYDGLESEDSLFYFGKKLARLGYTLPDDLAEDLEPLLEEIVASKPVVRIRLKTKGEFQNAYIDKLLSDSSESDEDEDEDDNESGDVPDDGDEDGIEWGEGDTCQAPFEGKMYPATITEIEDDNVTVEDDEGETWEVKLSELEPSEDEDDEGEEDQDEGEEDEDEKEIDLEKGMTVEVETDEGEIKGKVTFISKDGETMSVRDEDGDLHKQIPVDSIVAVVEDEVPDEPKRKPRTGSKVTKKSGSRRKR